MKALARSLQRRSRLSDDMSGELNRAGSTVCVAIHDPRYAAHANRAIHLLDGRVVFGSAATN